MNAVFQCPRCNTPLGTPDNPKPEAMPPCPNCGWARTVPTRRWLTVGYVVTACVLFVVGLGGGWLVGHSLLLVIHALVVFGPVATVGIARTFSPGWFTFNACYVAGLYVGMTGFNDGQTIGKGAWQFPALVATGSLLLGWLVGWFKHSD